MEGKQQKQKQKQGGLAEVPGAKVRLMCSYGGHIMSRAHDNGLTYVGGETRMVGLERQWSVKEVCWWLSRRLVEGRAVSVKYQMPEEGLDNLISLSTDDDLSVMLEEYDRLHSSSSPSRLRLFLFLPKPLSSLSLSHSSFLHALNHSSLPLDRVLSDSAPVQSLANVDFMHMDDDDHDHDHHHSLPSDSSHASANSSQDQHAAPPDTTQLHGHGHALALQPTHQFVYTSHPPPTPTPTVYVMPLVGPTPPYKFTMHEPTQPPLYPTNLLTTPSSLTLPDSSPTLVNPPAPPFLPITPNPFHQHYIAFPPNAIPHPTHSSASASAPAPASASPTTTNYAYDQYAAAAAAAAATATGTISPSQQDQLQLYYTQHHQSSAPPPFQSITPSPAAAFSDASKKFPIDNNNNINIHHQSTRTITTHPV